MGQRVDSSAISAVVEVGVEPLAEDNAEVDAEDDAVEVSSASIHQLN